MATLSEYAAKVRNFYWEEMICDINNLEDSEAENMVNIAISHVSIAYHLLDQARLKNFRYIIEEESKDREIRKANEITDD